MANHVNHRRKGGRTTQCRRSDYCLCCPARKGSSGMSAWKRWTRRAERRAAGVRIPRAKKHKGRPLIHDQCSYLKK